MDFLVDRPESCVDLRAQGEVLKSRFERLQILKGLRLYRGVAWGRLRGILAPLSARKGAGGFWMGVLRSSPKPQNGALP